MARCKRRRLGRCYGTTGVDNEHPFPSLYAHRGGKLMFTVSESDIDSAPPPLALDGVNLLEGQHHVRCCLPGGENIQ